MPIVSAAATSVASVVIYNSTSASSALATVATAASSTFAVAGAAAGLAVEQQFLVSSDVSSSRQPAF